MVSRAHCEKGVRNPPSKRPDNTQFTLVAIRGFGSGLLLMRRLDLRPISLIHGPRPNMNLDVRCRTKSIFELTFFFLGDSRSNYFKHDWK